MNRVRRFWFATVVVVVSTLLTLGLIEVALRVQEASQPDAPQQKGKFWQEDQRFGWSLVPGREGVWFNDQKEFSVNVRINSKGLRDVEHEYAKTPGVFRVLLIGDSYMEALQVPLEDAFPRLLEAELNRAGRQVEIVSAAAADWGTDNQLEYFRQEGIKYSPDLVLLAFTTANDVRNNSVVLNRRVPRPNLHKPTFVLRPDGQLVYHPTPPSVLAAEPPQEPWWRRLRITKFVSSRLAGVQPVLPPAPTTKTATPPPAPPPKGVPTDMLVYAPTYSAEVAEAWRVTKALVAELRKVTEASGAKFAVVLVNGPWAHDEGRWRFMLMRDPEAQKTWLRRRPNDEIASFLTDANIPYLDLFDAFEAMKSIEPLYFKNDPHWTSAGHRVGAAAATRFLVEQRLVPEGSKDLD